MRSIASMSCTENGCGFAALAPAARVTAHISNSALRIASFLSVERDRDEAPPHHRRPNCNRICGRCCRNDNRTEGASAVRGLGSLVGLVLVLGIGYWIYSAQLAGTSHEEPVRRRIDIVGVRADLLAFAQAERFHMAARGSYTTLEQLREWATVS